MLLLQAQSINSYNICMAVRISFEEYTARVTSRMYRVTPFVSMTLEVACVNLTWKPQFHYHSTLAFLCIRILSSIRAEIKEKSTR